MMHPPGRKSAQEFRRRRSGHRDPAVNPLRVLLTGSSGSVGSGVLEALVADGGFVVDCLVRGGAAAAAAEARGGRVVTGDMTDDARFDDLRGKHDYEFIVHAAQASYRDHTPAEIDALERQAVRNLEKLCTPATRLMIFTSGVWMYGNGAGGAPITEATPWRPFALSRERNELLRELGTRREFPWAQLCPPSFVYGNFASTRQIVETLRQGGSIPVLDDESVWWSVIERLDLGRAFVALLRHGRPGDNFVVAEDEPVRVIAFYEAIAAAVGRGCIVREPLEHAMRTRDPGWLEVARTSQPVDATRFKQRTGWQAREKFATSAPRIFS